MNGAVNPLIADFRNQYQIHSQTIWQCKCDVVGDPAGDLEGVSGPRGWNLLICPITHKMAYGSVKDWGHEVKSQGLRFVASDSRGPSPGTVSSRRMHPNRDWRCEGGQDFMHVHLSDQSDDTDQTPGTESRHESVPKTSLRLLVIFNMPPSKTFTWIWLLPVEGSCCHGYSQ